ncbi:MAG TPA: CPBP family intramembrane glutamic endopeptidase [Stackebrandtia sp.]|uniref:CPBP family intramembrane glutamic endopeptidase n=1 Tax=Stackebrandtia sp. TaxID=2023065 RepID=UPI002D6790EF|nr:CPBP family intramembrane glutamic endopeptidase [Stackebrandtia sp.]HZE37706.1 CPBP family intramembrane glutamic endopeptidase [Stackebrandtia sp.]
MNDSPVTAPSRPIARRAASAVWATLSRNRRLLRVLAVIIAVLAGVNFVTRFGPIHTGIEVEPAVAVALIVLARRHGLSWHDLGLSRRTWGRGLRYAATGVAAVAAVYLVGLIVPLTRQAFIDSRYELGAGTALLTGLVLVPLGTVLLEEVAFRGVLIGLLGRHKNLTLAISVSSVLFGLWHVLPSLAMGANRLVASVVGEGVLSHVLMVAVVVAFTGGAGWLLCEVRRRSGSLLAPVGLHWATNGLGVLLTSALWSLRLV